MKTRRFFLLVCMLIASYTGFAQKIMIGNEETDRKLTWEDFKGNPDMSSSFAALTSWFMGYSMTGVRFYGDSIHIGKLDVNLRFDTNKSWLKKDKKSDWLLQHEQGHFNIGKMCLKEFMEVYKTTKLTKHNFDDKMKEIFTTTLKKYREMDLLYDAETEHSQNIEAQNKWNKFFEENMN